MTSNNDALRKLMTAPDADWRPSSPEELVERRRIRAAARREAELTALLATAEPGPHGGH